MNLSFFNNQKLPVILQDQIAECGLTSVTMCFNFHGLNVELSSIRNKYPVSNLGSSLHDLIEICQHEGFVADAYEMEIDDFPELKLPAIIHWDLNHFVVLKKIKGNTFTIHDPAIGEINYTKSEFSKHFTGFSLEISPGKSSDFDAVKSAWDKKEQETSLSLYQFIKRTSGFYKSFGFIMFMTFVAQLLSMSIPSITQVVIDDFIVSQTTEYMWVFIVGGLSIILFRYFADLIKSWSIIFIGYRWHANFSSYFYTKLLKLPLNYFETRSVSDIFSRFSALDHLKEALTDRVVQGVIDGFMSIVTIIAMFFYSPKMASISLVFVLIYFILRVYVVSKEIQANKKHIVEKVKETNSFYDTLANIQSVKIYGKETERYQQWKKYYLSAANESINLSKAKMWYSSSENLLSGLENIILLGVAATVVISGELTLGMMFAFFAYQIIFAAQSKSMLNNILEMKLLGIHTDRLNDIEINDAEQNILGQPGIKPEVKGKIEVKNLHFKYPGTEKPLFDNFNMTIEPGENIVLSGPSGCGKTTLIKIIMGLIEPQAGEIIIDGINIKTMGLQHYRKNIASVSQKESLVSGSVLDNISFFSKPIDMERIVESATKANIHDDIMLLPMQYQTLSGDIGSTFSGGQEQRILLARALYNNPKILFMDEATSFLDQKTEKEIVKTLKALDVTRVSIAHRQETINMASRVIKINS
jgi:ATP-binding cassette subfamily B protein RaxB